METLSYPFMLRAAIAALLVGMLCPLVGTFVVLRRLSFIGDGIAHASFAGIVVAYLRGIDYLLGAAVVAVASAIGIGYVHRRGVTLDTAIGVIFTGAFALGVFLMSRTTEYSIDLQGLLFGNILAVSNADLILLLMLGLLVTLLVAVLYRPLLYTSFDPIVAEASGVDASLVDTLLLIALALTIVVSLQAVGIILVAALLVTPAATAGLLCRRITPMLLTAMAIGVCCGVGGLAASYLLGAASGATIVLMATLLFALVFLVRRVLSGALSGVRRTLGLGSRSSSEEG